MQKTLKVRHPSLYEINTRVWLNRFSQKESGRLSDVPISYWNYLKDLGMDYVWLMGIWKTNEVNYDRKNLTDHQLQQYKNSLDGFQLIDLIGSPYAVDCYEINPIISKEEDFRKFKKKLNELGLKIILDFVPNHFGKHSRYLEINPDLLMRAQGDEYIHHPHLFFNSNSSHTFAHGKDPYFGPWIDTVQIDYSKKQTRDFMKAQLLQVSELCDGVRCDMAMMVLNDVFNDSWKDIIPNFDSQNWDVEFWEEAIQAVKLNNPEFIFIAESYWDKEAELLEKGFDYSYDKSFTDSIIAGDILSIRSKYLGNRNFQNSQLRFLENHDEQRILSQLSTWQSRTAASLLASSPGMKLYYQGQLEGKKTHTSVHLGRSQKEGSCQCPFRQKFQLADYEFQKKATTAKRNPLEINCSCNYLYYFKLFSIVDRAVFKNGDWSILSISQLENDLLSQNVVCMSWVLKDEKWVTLVNYSPKIFQGEFRINLDKENAKDGSWYWQDQLNDQDIHPIGHYSSNLVTHVELEPYSSRYLFLVKA